MNGETHPIIGFFRSALKLLTENWGLKLLSLILALIIYHSMKSEDSRQHTDNDGKQYYYR